MSKSNRKKQQNAKNSGQRYLVLLAIILIVVIAIVGVIIVSSGSDDGEADNETAANVADTGNEGLPSDPVLISPNQYMDDFGLNSEGHLLIDVRTPQEFDSGHIPGAININVEELASRLAEIPDDEPIVVYCRSGNRSSQAARILDGAGYQGIYDLGGIIDWQAANLPIE